MVIKKSYAVKSDCYRAGRTITVKGLMIHSVGCSQPNPEVFFNNWNKPNAGACVHGVLGADGTVLQLLPWNYKGWHCASGVKGSGNNTHIGVEMTEPATIKYLGGATFKDLNPTETKKFVLSTYKHAVELFAKLCVDFKLDPLKDGVIISHHEGFLRGIASNHGDVEHLWSKFGLTMEQFRKDIKSAMSTKTSPSSSSSSNIGVATDFKPFIVRVTADELNIRKSASSSSAITGVITDKGAYTITRQSGKWGYLKSGLGWIHLSYTDRVK